MKRFLSVATAVLILLGLASCGSENTDLGGAQSGTNTTAKPGNSMAGNDSQEQSSTDGKRLVVYFSLPETQNPDNMTDEEANSTVIIDGKVLGNTQFMAMVIKENTGADIFRIEPETAYPTDHEKLVEQAQKEQNDSTRPALASQLENIDSYDTIFVGYPNWWGDMPMILYTFFESYDFAGKTIIPFNTHGGSGFSGTVGAIKKLEPAASVQENGLSISRNGIQDAEPDIIAWLAELGLQK